MRKLTATWVRVVCARLRSDQPGSLLSLWMAANGLNMTSANVIRTSTSCTTSSGSSTISTASTMIQFHCLWWSLSSCKMTYCDFQISHIEQFLFISAAFKWILPWINLLCCFKWKLKAKTDINCAVYQISGLGKETVCLCVCACH